MRAHWRHLANTIELVHLSPTRVHNRNAESIGSAVFAQMTAECPYTLQWSACFRLKIAPSHVRKKSATGHSVWPVDVTQYVVHWGHPSPERKWQLDRFSRFFQDSLV